MAKIRVDSLLVARGLAPSRARAQAIVLAGKVFVAGARVDKAGTQVGEDHFVVAVHQPVIGVLSNVTVT